VDPDSPVSNIRAIISETKNIDVEAEYSLKLGKKVLDEKETILKAGIK
jgi:hypothetical protein